MFRFCYTVSKHELQNKVYKSKQHAFNSEAKNISQNQPQTALLLITI